MVDVLTNKQISSVMALNSAFEKRALRDKMYWWKQLYIPNHSVTNLEIINQGFKVNKLNSGICLKEQIFLDYVIF